MAGAGYGTKNGKIPAIKGEREAGPKSGVRVKAAMVELKGDLKAPDEQTAARRRLELLKTEAKENQRKPVKNWRLKAVIPELRDARTNAARARSQIAQIEQPVDLGSLPPHIAKMSKKKQQTIIAKMRGESADARQQKLASAKKAAEPIFKREARAQRMFDALMKQRARMRRNKGKQGDLFARLAA